MSDFEYDCIQKKKLANQARHRKRRSKSKKCSLPSDRLTQKQWKERCGPVMNYNLGSPMSWEDFKRLPIDIQTEYIKILQEKYGATSADLALMFGVKAQTVRRHVESKEIPVTFDRGHSMNFKQREVWSAFIAREQLDNDEDIQEEPTIPTIPEYELPVLDEMKMSHFSIQFGGKIDIDAIANTLRVILGENATGIVDISLKLG